MVAGPWACDFHFMRSQLEQLSIAYEQAESAFLEAVSTGRTRGEVALVARATADAAVKLNAAAYKSLHAGVENAWIPLDHLTERTEVSAELWADVAVAYER